MIGEETMNGQNIGADHSRSEVLGNHDLHGDKCFIFLISNIEINFYKYLMNKYHHPSWVS